MNTLPFVVACFASFIIGAVVCCLFMKDAIEEKLLTHNLIKAEGGIRWVKHND